MKKIYLLSLLFGPMLIYAQTGANKNPSPLLEIKKLLDPRIPGYDPAQAFRIYSNYAEKGNAEAMNGLGMLYMKGVGVAVDENEAVKFFKKAAKAGYATAWQNLGLMYKAGSGIEQNYEKAYEAFCKGAELNNAPSYYGKGYMLYKGLGCAQNYQLAFESFTKAAALKELGSMYMLGLCYRNGYGVSVNLDSANYWLNKSSKGGYNAAREELKTAEAENPRLPSNANITYPMPKTDPVNLKTGYKKVKQKMSSGEDISGEYTGFVIKFDWSGKHIISKLPLTIKIKQENQRLTGQWIENEGSIAYINGQLSDSSVTFANTGYEYKDHYNKKIPNKLEFKKAQLRINTIKDTTFIVGNLLLHSTRSKEPEKPTFVTLMKVQPFSAVPKTLANFTSSNSAVQDSLNFIAFPNPFKDVIQVTFNLPSSSNVRFMITSVLNGTTVYKGQQEFLKFGKHTKTIPLVVSPGYYVLNVIYNKGMKAVLIGKN